MLRKYPEGTSNPEIGSFSTEFEGHFDRLTGLAASIAAGTYHIPADELSGKLMERMLEKDISR